MCGIVGFISKSRLDSEDVISAMVDKLKHRGPDSNGFWKSDDSLHEVVLGHTRLSILDLSSSGSQPMLSHSGRFTIVFNGEIYNNKELKLILEKEITINWEGHSDTEIFLESIEHFGIDKALALSSGMFAFALWDKKKQELLIARDRMGEKPLYYGFVNENFVFASELSAIESFSGFNNEIDRDALCLYLKYSSIPAPFSIYKGLKKLNPGTYISIEEKNFNITENTYYDLKALSNQDHYAGLTDKVLIDNLEVLIKKAVSSQMQSDVPTGAFLSGGVDSSTIAALMQAQSTTKINTFSIGFDVKDYNEAEFARQVAQHLKTDHHDLYVSGQDALDVIPNLSKIYSEPFADSSQIPTYLVSKIAKEKVTVCLTGDAGDELFCGYSRYPLALQSWNKISKVPYPLRVALQKIIQVLPQRSINNFFGNVNSGQNKLDKFFKASKILDASNRNDFYHRAFLSHNDTPSDFVVNGKSPKTIYNTSLNNLNLDSFLSEMMLLDLLSYLPTDNLVKVDRASMSLSLETRVPLLDKDVVRFAQSIPIDLKYRDGVDKWILRQVLYKYVPKQLIERPKMGFAVPLSEWLRGPLKEWASVLLDRTVLEKQGLFNSDLIQQKWDEHISGKRNWQYLLWDILMFQSWYNERKL